MTSLEKHIIKGIRLGNVTQVTSTCPWLNSQTFSETFTYDASDQLTAAEETQSQSYRLDVGYGDWGRITDYALTRTDMQDNSSTSDAYSFTYPANPSGVQGAQTMLAPESQTGTTDAQFTFGINGSLRKREVTSPDNYTEYYLFNSQANLKAYSDDGLDFAYYGYNASNTRTYKLTMTNANQWVNGQPGPLSLQLQQAMFYPNAYLNFNHNGEYTKHYYNGSERFASRLGDAQPESFVISSNDRLGFRTMQADEQSSAELLELVFAGDVPIETPSVDVTTLQVSGNPDDIFYYHTNHLGSTAFITDNNTNIHQGFLYAPFGEITTEYDINFGYNVLPKYSFNAKELDEETGMYYYEARYYKPPVFTSRDPMFEKYFWMSPYAYCANNTVKYVDPTGCTIVIIGEDGTETTYEPGMTYEGNDEFTQKAITILNDGYSNSATAERMIGELCGPEYIYKIESGVESNYAPLVYSIKSQYGSNESFYEKCGGVITWNTSGMGTFEQDPQGGPSILKKRPSISLFHELAHAWDNMAGLMAGEDMEFQDLKVNEWTATRTENMIRKELKLPLRTYYYVCEWEGKNHPEGPRLLDSEGNHRYTQYQHQ